MSTTNLICFAIKIFSFLILFQIDETSSNDYSALLSRLYKRAAAADRPLIVLIDSSLLQSERQTNRQPDTILDAIGYNRLENRGASINNLLTKPKKSRNKFSYKPLKSYGLEKKLHHSLVPMQKRVAREKEILRSPIIKSLLRISNNLRCQARNECENQCNRYKGRKNNKCVNSCETKFECDEEPEESGCDECQDDNSCDNQCEGSTKGYASTEPPVRCPQC